MTPLLSLRSICVLLLVAVVASGVALAWSKHRARALYNQLEELSQAHDEAQLEWGQLQLQQASEGENSRVEQIARERLGLKFPGPENTLIITP